LVWRWPLLFPPGALLEIKGRGTSPLANHPHGWGSDRETDPLGGPLDVCPMVFLEAPHIRCAGGVPGVGF